LAEWRTQIQRARNRPRLACIPSRRIRCPDRSSDSVAPRREGEVMIEGGKKIGPSRNEFGSMSCIGCRHLAFHDWHYPYCSAQENENNKGRDDGYPWKDAGTHIIHARPNDMCPFKGSAP